MFFGAIEKFRGKESKVKRKKWEQKGFINPLPKSLPKIQNTGIPLFLKISAANRLKFLKISRYSSELYTIFARNF